jgi:two-component system, OmpR family, sensor histidine kinase KdpD
VTSRLARALVGPATVVALGAAMLPLRAHLSIATAALVLVVPVVVGVIAGGYPGGVASVIAGFVVVDFAYIPPYKTLTVGAAQNWAALGVYVVVMLLVAQVVAHLRAARAEAQRREEEARRLFTLTELLVEGGSVQQLLETIVQAIATVFDVGGVALLLPEEDRLTVAASAGTPIGELELSGLAPRSGVPVSVGTLGSDPRALRTIALTASGGPVGILALRGLSATVADGALLGSFANHAALALERVQLRTRAERSERLEEIDRVSKDLLGAVSHDLRTPLATMKIASSALLDTANKLSEQDTAELHGLLDAQTDRLTRLVTSLLDLNRYESGVLTLQREPKGVLDLIGDALADMRPTLGDRAVELDVPSALPDVDADRILMGQVLANLFDNAERHSPPGAPIRVRAALDGGRISVAVIDSGPGVPPEERDTLFQSFVRFDTGGRAGLGLAIAKTFVEAHGERIWVEDVEGGGARFVFTMLPHRDGTAG